MSLLSERLQQLRGRGGKALIPFLVAGDPDLETSRSLLIELARGGAAAIEVGVPFSDPAADGPTIQRAAERALAHGTRLSDVLELGRDVFRETGVPLVLFSYLNPLLQYGLQKLVDELSGSGFSGVLVTDLPHEESEAFDRMLAARDIALIPLVAPTTTDVRLEAIVSRSRGFVYAISRSGVTGAADRTPKDARALVARVRRYTDSPVAVGFGISSAGQVAEVWTYADAAIIGSALVSQIEKHSNTNDLLEHVRNYFASLQPSEVPNVNRNA